MVVGLLLLVTGMVLGQQRRGRRDYGEGVHTAREWESGSTGTPTWTNAPAFEKDVFTFARIRYDRGGYGRGGGWATDLPDSDLNFSFRLQQITSLKVDPDARNLRLTDPELAEFPFIYIVEPGGLTLSDAEALALRKHLLNGGFLMLDDFWGERGVTWERPDAKEVHHRAIFDDQHRMMVIATHNTDNGDGWEREGESDYYFHNFSEKIAYPLGINILFYAMTH
jgi:hypothetical protein